MAYEILDEEDIEEDVSTGGRYEILDEEEEITPKERRKTGSLSEDLISGGILGASDLALGVPALAAFPFEWGINKAIGGSSEPGLLPGAQERGRMESESAQRALDGTSSLGDILALMSDDEFLPMGTSGTSLANLQAAQERVPEGGLVQEGSRIGTRNLPALLGGPAAYGGALGADVAGTTAANVAGGLGAPPWLQFLIGTGTAVATHGLTTSPRTQAKAPYIAQSAEEAGQVLPALERQVSPKTLKKRLQGLEEGSLREIEDRLNKVSSESLDDVAGMNLRDYSEWLHKTERDNALDNVSATPMTEKDVWTQTAKTVNEAYKEEREALRPKYEAVRQEAKNVLLEPGNEVAQAKQLKKELNNVKTSPSAYKTVSKVVDDVISDLAPKGKKGKDGKFIKPKPVTADKGLDLSVRLNDLINFEGLTPSIIDRLKPLRKSIKQRTAAALKEANERVYETLVEADKEYQGIATKYGTDTIRKLRSTELPESLTAEYLKPSNIEDLRNLLGGTDTWASIERQIVDALGRQSYDKGIRTLEKLSPYLSQRAKQSAQELINLGDIQTPSGRVRATQNKIADDVASAIQDRKDPVYTLNIMQTPRGYDSAKRLLSISPEGKRLFNILERKVLDKMLDGIKGEKGVDWQKMKPLLKDPDARKMFQKMLGNDGVQFIENLDKYRENITRNLDKIKKVDPTAWQKITGSLGVNSKVALGTLLGSPILGVGGVAAVGAGVLGTKIMARAITSPAFRNYIRRLAARDLTPSAALSIVRNIDRELEEDME